MNHKVSFILMVGHKKECQIRHAKEVRDCLLNNGKSLYMWSYVYRCMVVKNLRTWMSGHVYYLLFKKIK